VEGEESGSEGEKKKVRGVGTSCGCLWACLAPLVSARGGSLYGGSRVADYSRYNRV
jgi:hypothetical protein